MSAAEKSFHNTNGKFKRKTKNVKKKWFNGEGEFARKLVLLASKNKHRDASNPTIRRSYNENFKHFEKVCQKNRNIFWEKKIDHIQSEYETSDVNF